MITLIVLGAGLLVVIAVVVGILAALASAWRAIAAQRRELWDARQPEFHAIDCGDTDGWQQAERPHSPRRALGRKPWLRSLPPLV